MSVHYLYLGATDCQPKTCSKPRGPRHGTHFLATKLFRSNRIELLSNAQRAPEVFSSWQGIEAIAAGARCGDVGSLALLIIKRPMGPLIMACRQESKSVLICYFVVGSVVGK